MYRNFKSLALDFTPPYFMRLAKRIYRGKYLAKDGIDKKMEKYLNYKNGYFVELGANEGIVQSNTYYFEKYKGWKGLLIEPSPNKYLECIANRSDKNSIYCAACVSFDYTKKFVELVYSDFMTTGLHVETDIGNPNEHAKKGEKYLKANESVFIFGAKAEQLNNLLIKSSAPNIIDFLSLDVEGAEIEVLKGVEHSRFRFKFLLIECRDFEKLNLYLTSNNYHFVEKLSHHDFLFADNS